ncbi:MAG: biotin transporter BioY [Eggerthellaceae bacterium]|nr:biotin transporter BioY [Eggerthellaceae bacterium]
MTKQDSNGTAAVARGGSRTRSLAFVGLTIAIVAVSAWITVPLGPIPFTLQMFAVAFAIVVLQPREAVAAIAGYLLLGAVGVPVFSGMRGGVGVLAGPTVGFLWGMLLGTVAGVALLHAVRTHTSWDFHCARARKELAADAGATPGKKAALFLRSFGIEVAACVLFTAISYLCGMVQYMAVAQVGADVAFATCVAPFIVVDALKIVAAVMVAQQVRAVVGR